MIQIYFESRWDDIPFWGINIIGLHWYPKAIMFVLFNFEVNAYIKNEN